MCFSSERPERIAPAIRYIPEFKNPQVLITVVKGGSNNLVPAKREITIHHLFNHTSGITYGGGNLGEYYRKSEISSGLDATGCIIGDMEKQPEKSRQAIFNGPRTYFAGGAGLCSTIPDYARFCQMLLNGSELDAVRILSRKSVELMTTDSTGGLDILKDSDDVRATHGDRYSLGFCIRAYSDDIVSVGSFGWGGAFHTFLRIDPKEDIIGIFMSQVSSMRDKSQHRKFRILAYQAIMD